ncbi:hypothetical protein BCR33DRAFT_851779 [Rhizoclosmatium globosum]|uniref:VHS domain-containing protein n=1 Tax=Rhizoclosmatium globosum TaxID=329046 RepID=A0A1Y2C5D9_9FUNG|nr:hypothetical protein BCR33DRAFT_851779 [Rhizoclosmatium globosum]|eukprot:ORY42260.1 hypothetical protein BCR33DRAFT_851779 [Rhizoclosmatium globosum]
MSRIGLLIDRATNGIESSDSVYVEIADAVTSHYATANPQAGCIEALDAIRQQLDFGNYLVNRCTLELTDFLFGQCGQPFINTLSQAQNIGALLHFIDANMNGTLKQKENKQICINLIGKWAIQVEEPKALQELFETLVRQGHKFPQEIWNQLEPGTYEKINTTGPFRGLKLRKDQFLNSMAYHLGKSASGALSADSSKQTSQTFLDIDRSTPVGHTPIVAGSAANSAVAVNEAPAHQQKMDGLIASTLNCTSLLAELLSVAKPEKDLMEECYQQCLVSQQDIVKLIDTIEDEDQLNTLMEVNVSVNDALAQYSQWKLARAKEREQRGLDRRETRALPSPVRTDSGGSIGKVPLPYSVWSGDSPASAYQQNA